MGDLKAVVRRHAFFLTSIAAIACVACSQHVQPSSTGPHNTPIPIWQLSPLERQRNVSEDALARLEQKAAPYDRADFGPGTRSLAYRSSTDIVRAYSAPDGMLYVVTSKTLGVSQYDLSSLATLNRGKIRQIPLQPVGKYHHGYSSIDFIVSPNPDEPYLRANDFEGHDYYFAVGPVGVRRLSASPGREYDPYSLSTGEECAAESSDRSPVAVWAINGGVRQAFVTKAALFSASRNLVDDQTLRFSSVRCFHPGNLDLLNVGDLTRGLVYTVILGKPRLITRGEILTSGARHILVIREQNNTGGGFDGEGKSQTPRTGLTDYLEVFNDG